MFLTDPFKVGPAVPLTEKQKAEQKLNEEWDKAGKPSLEESIKEHNEYASRSLKRALESK